MDIDDLMPASEETATSTNTPTETASSEASTGEEEPLLIPGNIDFVLNTNIGVLKYDGLDIKNVDGKIRIKDQVAYLDGLNMNAMGGSIGMTGNYNSTNHAKPSVDFSYDLANINVEELTKYFTSIETMAPVAKHAKGSFSSKFKMKSDLMPNLDPIYNSLVGNGNLFTSSMEIDGYAPLVKLSDALKMDKLKKQTLKDVKASFEFSEGRVNLKPMETKFGKIPTNISGYTTFEQQIDYSMLMNIPKEEIPAGMLKVAEDGIKKLNSLAPGLSVSGLPAVIPVTVKMIGSVTDPKVTTNFKEALMKASGNVKDDLINQGKELINKGKDSVKAIVDDKIKDVKEDLTAKKEKIMADAQVQANRVKAEAKKAADETRKQGNIAADKLMSEAGNNPLKKKVAEIAANKTRSEADEKAKKIEQEGNQKADSIMDAARKKADSL
jgi:hypothetical protein